jgi:hypothetical protein
MCAYVVSELWDKELWLWWAVVFRDYHWKRSTYASNSENGTSNSPRLAILHFMHAFVFQFAENVDNFVFINTGITQIQPAAETHDTFAEFRH